MKILLLLLFSLSGSCLVSQEKRITRSEYITKYGELAVREMKHSGIPASITLAQACLESDDGNSTLAHKGNNHFGIKCHNNWPGDKIYKDDDSKGECFRKYYSAKESFRDHSDFLKNSKRYSFLFGLDPCSYKDWAKGLKEAGYATNPRYPELLIKIIEDNKLYEYDSKTRIKTGDNESEEPRSKQRQKKKQALSDPDNFTYTVNNIEIRINNRIKYVIASKTDSPEKLAKSLDIFVWEIIRYNELTNDSVLRKGQLIYIQPKRNKAEPGKDYHIACEGETLYTVSQKYGIKLKKLALKNKLNENSTIKAGDKLFLRKNKN